MRARLVLEAACTGPTERAAAEHGLAVTGGAISTTGIAGLTLGGGLGWLMAKHGLAADTSSPRVVSADGDPPRSRPSPIPTCSGPCVAAAGTSACDGVTYRSTRSRRSRVD